MSAPRYVVVGKKGVLVRETAAMDSAVVAELPQGAIFQTGGGVQLAGGPYRLRLVDPVHGFVSLKANLVEAIRAASPPRNALPRASPLPPAVQASARAAADEPPPPPPPLPPAAVDAFRSLFAEYYREVSAADIPVPAATDALTKRFAAHYAQACAAGADADAAAAAALEDLRGFVDERRRRRRPTVAQGRTQRAGVAGAAALSDGAAAEMQRLRTLDALREDAEARRDRRRRAPEVTK
ncbi:hypothetical protein M885DRAFT_621972 [Pelagophyceae sp. CCMP2097]|nr:hypothetical protein M885DRAFT_621972 [Pelagophyceae sp. CCMP2097]